MTRVDPHRSRLFPWREQMLVHAFSNYDKYAWGANEHRPISKVAHSANVFGSDKLGITIIDSLDTLYLADLKQLYEKSRQWIDTQFNPDVVGTLQTRSRFSLIIACARVPSRAVKCRRSKSTFGSSAAFSPCTG